MAAAANKWNIEETLKFLDIYEQYECLWNIRHPQYTNKVKREIVTKKLMKELTDHDLQIDNVEFLRKKIKSLKNVYRQEVVKIQRSKKSGGLVYRPKLSWFPKADSFLNNVFRSTPMKSDLIEECEEENVRPSAKSSLPLRKKSPVVLKKRPKFQITNVSSAINKLQTNAPKEEDEFSFFGDHIACQLRQLPIRSSLLLQEQIQSMITRERLFHTENDSHYNASETLEENNSSAPTESKGDADSNYEYVCKFEEEEETVSTETSQFNSDGDNNSNYVNVCKLEEEEEKVTNAIF